MKTLRKVLLVTGLVLLSLPLVLAVAVMHGERRRFEAPYPDLHASTDPKVIARGRYLVNGPAHCSGCHDAQGGAGAEEPTLSGGFQFHLPLGTFYTPNLTPDRETGIGRRTDAELARILRYGVHPDGRASLPFMRFNNVSDEDLTAIISYLRSRPPVRNEVKPHEINLLGRVVKALVVRPIGPTAPPPVKMPAEPTPAYGQYLTTLSNCVACHTKVNLKTGALDGPLFAGGAVIPGHTAVKATYAPPNLTPAPKTGRITDWNEETFLARFHMGTGAEGSPMPWKQFSRMSDDDLRAIFRYLRTLPPVENDTGPSVRFEGEPVRVSKQP